MWRRANRAAFGALIAAAALVIGVSQSTAVANDGQLGGPPGFTADSTLCPAGEAVTGVTGFTRIIGGFIPIVAVATVQCTDGTATGTMGSGGGGGGGTACPSGQVAVGITGAEGDFADLLTLLCRDAGGLVTASQGLFGGGRGVPDGPYTCPADTVLTGLTGEVVPGAEDTIRFVEIVCGTATPPDDDNDGIADTPPPTDKDQCKDGGWATFNNPSFRNQGQCTSYVERRR